MEHRHVTIKPQKTYFPKERMKELEGAPRNSVILLSSLLGNESSRDKRP